MIINTARFVISNTDYRKCPTGMKHEYAFIGRSNVGKSSLINMLTGKKGLAMTSATPGKTMLINHFLVDDSWYIVDLPGYGYARRSKADRDRLEHIIKSYILGREQMTNLFVLVDSRHAPQRIDLEFMEWLGENGIPFSIVFTKIDKQSATAADAKISAYLEQLLDTWEELPPVFRTSSEKGIGREAILDYIAQMNRLPLLDDGGCTPATDYRGVDIDIADGGRVSDEAVAEDVAELNNNPRNG